MIKESFFHLCADGADAKNFIVTIDDAYAAFNLVGVCAANSNAIVAAFSIEDSHPHFLLYGTLEDCLSFKEKYGVSYKRHLATKRGTLDGIVLTWTLYEITDSKYLMNAAAYVVTQPTKDGKKVMPYDYLWGSGSLYFRPANNIPIWCVNKSGKCLSTKRICDLTVDERLALLHSKMKVPDEWITCNGFLLPCNYVDVEMFQKIFVTHNCFRTFLSSGRSKDSEIMQRLAQERGVQMEDSEIRKPCGDLAKEMFGVRDVRRLNPVQRIELALELRKRYRLSQRQIATLVRLPLTEVEKYVR